MLGHYGTSEEPRPRPELAQTVSLEARAVLVVSRQEVGVHSFLGIRGIGAVIDAIS